MVVINRIYNEFNLGASSPFTIIHVSDVHLTETDESDSLKIKALAAARRLKYTFSETVLDGIREVISDTEGLLLITGDMMDFNSSGNFEKIRRFTDENQCLFVAGNHDFRPFGGMEYDVPEYREKNLPKVQQMFGNDIRFFSKIVNGINIVGIDNCYYRFEKRQFEMLKEEVAKGFPVILTMHVPFYTEETYDLVVRGKRKHASQVCVPEEKMTEYPEERYIQQKEDEITRLVFDYVLNEKAIKLLICGHIHKDCESVLPDGTPQLVTNVNTARIITIR